MTATGVRAAPPGPRVGRPSAADAVEPGVERRSTEPVRVLSREHDETCVAAVDPLEIAAGLEASGMSDQACTRLGHPDVFALAEELYRLVPRRAAGTAGHPRRPPVPVRRCAVRGLIYALPGLAGIALGVGTRERAGVMLVALAVGWGWSAAMAALGHRQLGWYGVTAARALLRHGIAWGAAVTAATVLVPVVLVRASLATYLVGVGLAWYMTTAGALLVLRRDGQVLAALGPAALAGVLVLLGLPEQWLLLTVPTVVGTTALALEATRRRVGDPPPRRTDLRPAAGHLVHGVASAILVGLGPPSLAVLRGERPSVAWFVALPLVLSMGPMELQLERLRRSTEALLWTVGDPGRFGRATVGALLRSLVVLLLVVGGLAAACWLGLRAGSGDTPAAVMVLTAYALLAACFFLGLVLISTGRVRTVAASFAAALVVYLVGSASLPPVPVFTTALAVLACVLLACALQGLRSPLVHL